MSVLLIAEHNNKEVKPFTYNAITAASQIDQDLHVLIIGYNADEVAKSISQVPSVKKVIQVDNEIYKNYIAEKNCYFVNMTGMMRTDQLIIALLANLKTGDKDFEEILLEHGLNEDLINMIYLFDPDTRVNLSEKDKKKLHDIMYTWFHPIKNEWYPYLHNLKNWG